MHTYCALSLATYHMPCSLRSYVDMSVLLYVAVLLLLPKAVQSTAATCTCARAPVLPLRHIASELACECVCECVYVYVRVLVHACVCYVCMRVCALPLTHSTRSPSHPLTHCSSLTLHSSHSCLVVTCCDASMAVASSY